MNKKIIAISLAVCLLVALGAGFTVAWLKAEASVENVFTVGNVRIALTEPAWDTTGFNDALEVYPGEALAKDPTVTNTGANPCLVRIKIEWPAGIEGITYRTNYVTGALGANWVDGKDGYFYYLKPLTTTGDESQTSPLFDQIVIPTTLTNGDAQTEYDVVVTAYAVQAQGVFPSYSRVDDGIDVSAELPTVIDFFNNAFAPAT